MRCGFRRWLTALGVGSLVVCTAATARADVQSDQAAAILVFPKLLVDTDVGIDTLIRLNNASNSPITLQCFYVNATPHCRDAAELSCMTDQRFASHDRCPSTSCIDQWQETDFRIVLTRNQPIAWLVSSGAVDCRSTFNGDDGIPDNNVPCFALDGVFRTGEQGQSNVGSRIPPVAEDPFVGELKCVAVDDTDRPVVRNDLYGIVSIIESVPGRLDVSTYNAIGIQALEQNNGDRTLVLGRAGDEGVEYNGCPNLLILDHFFDFAIDPVTAESVTTNLTLVPCSQDFLRQDPAASQSTVQFLVFNEFEQRFSTSRFVNCYRDIQISNLDTRTNNRSIFSAPVAGTLTGQTRIRGVADEHSEHGHTVLGVAEEYRRSGTAAFNLQAQGVRPQNDFLYLP